MNNTNINNINNNINSINNSLPSQLLSEVRNNLHQTEILPTDQTQLIFNIEPLTQINSREAYHPIEKEENNQIDSITSNQQANNSKEKQNQINQNEIERRKQKQKEQLQDKKIQ